MQSTIYGYVRVSSKDQNEARQMIAMQEFGIEARHIFSDTVDFANILKACQYLVLLSIIFMI